MGAVQTMRFQYTPHVGILIVAAVISAVVAFSARRRRAAPGGTPLTNQTACVLASNSQYDEV